MAPLPLLLISEGYAKSSGRILPEIQLKGSWSQNNVNEPQESSVQTLYKVLLAVQELIVLTQGPFTKENAWLLSTCLIE